MKPQKRKPQKSVPDLQPELKHRFNKFPLRVLYSVGAISRTFIPQS